MKNRISIAYTPTNDTCQMTLVSMQSVIENNKNNEIEFYIVIDKYFEESNISLLKKFIKYKNCLNVNILNIEEDKYKKLPTVMLSSDSINHFLYCLDFANLINNDKVLYLSTFCIVNDDLSEIFNIDIADYSCATTEYIYSKHIMQEKGIRKEIFFHNSILLMNLKKWKEKQYFEKLLAKDFSNNKGFNQPETTIECFNILVNDCKLIDFKYNYTEDWYTPNSKLACSNETKIAYKNFSMHIEKPLIIAFIGPKPISELPCKNSYANLWWKYAEQTEIYEKIKDYRIVNKYKLTSTSAQNSFQYAWLLSRIFPYIKPYIPRVILGFLIAIPLGLLDGVTAFALKPYMDYVIGGKTLELDFLNNQLIITSLMMAFILPIGVVLFAAIQGVLRYLNDYISAWTSQRITNDVKFDLFHRLIYMHPQFFDDNSSGIVISRYMGDPAAASAGIVEQIKTITTSLCGALGLIAVMIYSSWELAFIGVMVLCIAFIPVAILRKRIKEASNKNMVIGGNITTNINETYSGNKVMTAYGLQNRQEEYFKEQVWKSFNINMSLTKRAAWMSPFMYLIASCGIAMVLGYGTYLITKGEMTAGSFASFVTSLLLLYKPVKTLGGTLAGIQNIFVAMGRVFELFDLEPNIKEGENTIEMADFKERIEFKDIDFEYVPNQPILKNLSLAVKKNETLAIVGNSGGGKSTLVNLLPRFYDIKSGSIEFDGVNIKNYSIKSLRRNISIVFQDNFLYSGSIKENILMGNPNATSEELMNAIKFAHLQDIIQDLPDGLDTVLGERGLTLSGGQRQRVAIARAMLRNAPIIILDEATSALDNKSEAIVQKALDNLMQNKTVFVIAHRLSTIKNADRIAVINEGELVELGTHNELMQIEQGQYKHLYDMQFRNQELSL